MAGACAGHPNLLGALTDEHAYCVDIQTTYRIVQCYSAKHWEASNIIAISARSEVSVQ